MLHICGEQENNSLKVQQEKITWAVRRTFLDGKQ